MTSANKETLFLFFFTQKWPKENDVIISKDKCHSGTYSFITLNWVCLHVETQSANSREDQLNRIFLSFSKRQLKSGATGGYLRRQK